MNPFISLLVNIVIQVVSCRFFTALGLLRSVAIGFLVGLMCVFFIEYLTFREAETLVGYGFATAACLAIYVALGYCYFHFVNLGETARRIRILIEIYRSSDGLSRDEILVRYNADEIVNKRMKRLLANGQIIYKNGKYFIGSPIMISIASIILFMKKLLLGRECELDRP